MNDHTALNEDSIGHENGFAENITDEHPTQNLNENCEPQAHAKTKPITVDNITNRSDGTKYACNQCDKQFTTQGNLKTHIQSKHEGVKYACNQCDQQFTIQSHLTRHIQSQHEGVKYACNQCDYQATTQSNLTAHIKRKHL